MTTFAIATMRASSSDWAASGLWRPSEKYLLIGCNASANLSGSPESVFRRQYHLTCRVPPRSSEFLRSSARESVIHRNGHLWN